MIFNTLICVGKHICVVNREIFLIGNREIKRRRICHDVKTVNLTAANLNGVNIQSISKSIQHIP